MLASDGSIKELLEGSTWRAHAAMVHLRPAFAHDRDGFVEQVDRHQRPAGYRLFAAFVAGQAARDDQVAAAVVGFRTVASLSWGRAVYVDDLSTDPAHRGRGLASQLLRAVEAEAARLGCDAVHLDSGHHRHTAHRLYLGAGYEIRAHHFVKLPDAG